MISESLRMFPPFPMLQRQCTQSFKIPDTDIVIEKGTSLIFSVFGLQHDPNYYENPMEYRPERYSGADKGFVEMPNLTFGEGPRGCIAQRLGKLMAKVAVILLLQKFQFELADEHKHSELKLSHTSATLSPTNGINLIAFKR